MLHHTDVFEDKCKVWQIKAPNLCTWVTMKQGFGDAHQDMILKSTTITGAGYHNANAANDAAANDYCRRHAEALANLTCATKSDYATVSGLVDANSSLTTKLASVSNKLADSLHKITLLCSNTQTQPNRQFQRNSPQSIRHFKNNYYCYTCGLDVPNWHIKRTYPLLKK